MRSTVNRVLLALAGLVLAAVGGAVLAVGLGASLPSWLPWDGKNDVLLSVADRHRWRDEGWWWPTVIAVLAVLVVLALWWFLAQLRRGRLAEVLVDSGDGEGAQLRGRALESVLAGESGELDGVARAQAMLTGRRTAPRARLRLLMEPHAAPLGTLNAVADGALTHARESAGLESLPAEVRLKAVKHRAERVS
ncbi:alkaline shock response membrane anchor protein AmaP [Streptomyces sp. SID14515]|uniref:alkaline shock response membrane anchor protein AmaP n=1 Tax=Streptomyces sp. SID14515 TaxID=2706074 RepID=UPI0013C5DA7B|nr:alkaline shock response membrane anchor protein AmaP [Streptomyces sp. SID14515]NEB39073.1 alkaline shock response membrane anchor protein AmaP [Streptomyces sp. SID14515]